MARAATVQVRGATALVTGAGSGIGRATALALAARGAAGVCVDLDEGAASAAAEECRRAGATATAHGLDVADGPAVFALAERVHADHGPLGVLVNNAGVGMTGVLADMALEDWAWIRGVNLDGLVHGCRAFGPAMVDAGRGHVVNVSSGLGYTPTATEPAYVTTKAGVLALSQCLRADWGRSGVGVSAICPGVINTPIIDRTRFLGDQADPGERAKATRAFRRGHRPEEVAEAIIGAVEANRAVVPVGWEAWVGWAIHRFAPVGAQQVIARSSRR